MPVLQLVLSILFVIAVILIWFMIGYQFVLTVFGYINYLRSLKEKREADRMHLDLPVCSVLIPAHNEEKVIARTLEALLNSNYPCEKLEIIVINDGSTDRTKEIVQRCTAKDARVKLVNVPAHEGGKGKSRALNVGIQHARGEVAAVYDADNTPDRDSLRYLIVQLLKNRELGAVIGKFRTVNKNVNLLTRFINIETLSFQSILQAGRWEMHKISTLPGTNFVIWKWLVRELNGWDEQALAEDSELSIRIYQAGYKIKYVPYAVTYEQEPQEWKVWIRQRLRWVQGNNYVITKFFRQIPTFKNKRIALDLLSTLALYYVFFAAIIISDALFIAGAFNLISIPLPGPYTLVWITAFLLFVFEIQLSISYDGESGFRNTFLTALMYFTYCQFWIYIVLKAIYMTHVRKQQRKWDKTTRFEVELEK